MSEPADPPAEELLPFEIKVAAKRATNERRLKAQAERARAKTAAKYAAEVEASEAGIYEAGPAEPEPVSPRAAEPEGGRPVVRPDGIVLQAFMQDWNFVTGIQGPWGSGKSVACIVKLFMAAGQQAPDRLGVRRTRWAVIRDSYPNLQETTIKSWLDWFPESVYGPMRRSRPMQHIIRTAGAPVNGRPTTIEMEVLFLALMDDEDRKKLLSMELTGAWINEARELLKSIIDDVIGRTGRYPSMRNGGATWAGCFMDTNAPSENHWWPIMAGAVTAPEDMQEEERDSLKKPKNWTFYEQPGALIEERDGAGRTTGWRANPLAENVKYLLGGVGWYLERIGGKTKSWIRINFCNQLGQIVAGKPVWPNFEKAKHVAASELAFDPSLMLHVGVDSTGRNPAALFGQCAQNHWRILGEVVARDVNTETFAPMVRRKISDIVRASGLNIESLKQVAFHRDPHSQRSDIDDTTVDQVFRKHGMRLMPAPGGNTIQHRLDTAEVIIDSYRITFSPSCRMTIAACDGGYRYRKLQVSGREEYSPEPEKNPASNPADALQYLLLGAGEGRKMVGHEKPSAPVQTSVGYKPRQNRTDLWRGRREWRRKA